MLCKVFLIVRSVVIKLTCLVSGELETGIFPSPLLWKGSGRAWNFLNGVCSPSLSCQWVLQGNGAWLRGSCLSLVVVNTLPHAWKKLQDACMHELYLYFLRLPVACNEKAEPTETCGRAHVLQSEGSAFNSWAPIQTVPQFCCNSGGCLPAKSVPYWTRLSFFYMVASYIMAVLFTSVLSLFHHPHKNSCRWKKANLLFLLLEEFSVFFYSEGKINHAPNLPCFLPDLEDF